MAAQSFLDELADVFDLLVEVDHPFRHLRYEFGSQDLSGQPDLLRRGRFHRLSGKSSCIADLLRAQPLPYFIDSGAADGLRALIVGEQHERTTVGQVQCLFQGWADGQQLLVQPADQPDAVTAKVASSSHQHAQLHDQLVIDSHWCQIPPHAGLIRNDRSIFRIGLPRASVSAGGAIDLEAGDIPDRLSAGVQQRQQQR
ncbi:hypothetical protein APR12_006306 [Nocardia amikacinitolerans]|nr:hypothetical protein [Nocardia amikacinitolerans]